MGKKIKINLFIEQYIVNEERKTDRMAVDDFCKAAEISPTTYYIKLRQYAESINSIHELKLQREKFRLALKFVQYLSEKLDKGKDMMPIEIAMLGSLCGFVQNLAIHEEQSIEIDYSKLSPGELERASSDRLQLTRSSNKAKRS